MRHKSIFKKKGQGSMPFGVIFSIFLIVVFVVVALTVGKNFISIGKCSSVGLFYEDLQAQVDNLWQDQAGETRFSIDLPNGIKKICFADFTQPITNQGEDYKQIELYDTEDANLFMVPPEEACNFPYKSIKHINISKITQDENPYCIYVDAELKLSKGFYDRSVLIE